MAQEAGTRWRHRWRSSGTRCFGWFSPFTSLGSNLYVCVLVCRRTAHYVTPTKKVKKCSTFMSYQEKC